MANIYLKHPVHGTKVATMEQEADADERNGWKRYDPNAPAPTVDTPVNELDTRRRRRQSDTQVAEEK